MRVRDLLGRFRRARLPASLRAALDLEPGERVIAHARAGSTGPGGSAGSAGSAGHGAGYAVATDRALYLPDAGQRAAGTRRVGWEHIDHAEWQRGGLYVREVASLDEEPREHRVPVTAARALPETIRERVTSSIAINLHRKLDTTGGVRVVGRRRPGTVNEVTWMLVFDAGLDPRDPDLRARAEQVLAEVRQQTGL